MSVIRYICRKMLVMAAVLWMFAGMSLHAQTKQLLAWKEDLSKLQNMAGDALLEHRMDALQFRNAIEFWLKYHPLSKVALKPAPSQPWGVEEMRSEVAALREAVDQLLKEDSGRPFNLGATEVSVTSEASPLSPVTDSLTKEEIANGQLLNLSAALDAMPGVSVDQAAGSRNEAYGRIRGFSTRGQVPFYLDGIPVYVPYDGYVDMNRFLTSDTAEVQIAKGYSSPLMGPNGLAGSINVVTKQPQKKFESSGLIGIGSGGQFLSSMGFGSKWDHFYIQGSFDWLQRDFIPLSGNFPLNKLQSNYERNNSASRDEKWSGRIAWTPKGRDQYSFSYSNQKGKKDGLQYIGPGAATYTQFWKWPYWNKNSYYLITNTGIGETSSIKFRAYYDQFRNALNIWDDGTYSTMKKSGSERSNYDDYTDGAVSEFTTRLLPRNTISASVFFKDDTHRSQDAYPGAAPFPKIYPMQRLREQQVSIGFQDALNLTSRLQLTAGLSVDYMKGLFVSGYNSDNTKLIPLTCLNSPKNNSFSGCAARVWTYNPQLSASYRLTATDTLFVIFSDRARFPLLKDSYSYRFQRAWPNPDLGPEHSRNWDIGYSHAFGLSTLLQLEYFHSDLRDAIQSIGVRDASMPAHCPGNSSGSMKGYCSINYNAGKETHEGAEISIRSTPIRRLSLNASYSYINRTIAWDYSKLPPLDQINISVLSLPSMYKNKFVGNAALDLPHHILALATLHYEGGIRLQDTYIAGSGAYGGRYGVVDIGMVAPLWAGVKLQAGIKNLFDRDYYYQAGFPQAGRNSYFNLRHAF